jgi:hypothetical protein
VSDATGPWIVLVLVCMDLCQRCAMTWTPDRDAAGDFDPAGAEPATVQLALQSPVRLHLAPIDTEKCQPGDTAFAVTIVGGPARPIARGMLPAAHTAALLASDLFSEPVVLSFAAWEEEGGVRGVIAALVPATKCERLQATLSGADEPWKVLGSAVSDAERLTFDDVMESDGGVEPRVLPFALGVVLRFPQNRKHAADLGDEAADLFATVLDGGAMDADEKQIENLLGGL